LKGGLRPVAAARQRTFDFAAKHFSRKENPTNQSAAGLKSIKWKNIKDQKASRSSGNSCELNDNHPWFGLITEPLHKAQWAKN
jgi:hypothetical protein